MGSQSHNVLMEYKKQALPQPSTTKNIVPAKTPKLVSFNEATVSQITARKQLLTQIPDRPHTKCHA